MDIQGYCSAAGQVRGVWLVLGGVALTLCRHWIAVFGLVVGRVLKESVSQLSSYIKNKNSKFFM